MKMKYVRAEKTRHGKTAYYFRRGEGERIRLPDDPESPEFFDAYALAMGGKHNTVKTRASLIREEKALSALEAALKGAKSRAREKKRPFDLTLNWARVELEAQCYKCAVSGIPFYFTKGEQRDRRNPFAPSIDRIDCAGGYTKDNCRIVIYAVNVMLSDWGDDVFYRIVEQVSQNKSGSFAPHLPPQGAALNKNN